MKLSAAVTLTLFDAKLKENGEELKPQSLNLLTFFLHLQSSLE